MLEPSSPHDKTIYKKTPSIVCYHLHQSFAVNAFIKSAFQSEILTGMKSTFCLGSTWYHLSMSQILVQHVWSLTLIPALGFYWSARAFTLKSTQRGVKPWVTCERKDKHFGSAYSSLNASSKFLPWKALPVLGKVSRRVRIVLS